MTTVPAVSVVIPTYNRAATIRASVESLLSEAVELEVVVVDDGSTDDTAAVLAACDDPRLRVLPGAHGGIAAARNRGVAASRAPLVAFHDSDDLALPGRLTIPVERLRAEPDVDFVILNGRMLPPDDAPREPERPWIDAATARRLAENRLDAVDVFRCNLGQLQGMCFTRRALDAIGPLDGSFTILDDLDLVLRVAARFRGRFVDRPAFAYRQHAGGIARNRLRLREESVALGDKLARLHPEVIDALGRREFVRRQARRWARIAAMRARAGDPAGARAAWRAALALAPWTLRYRWQMLWARNA